MTEGGQRCGKSSYTSVGQNKPGIERPSYISSTEGEEEFEFPFIQLKYGIASNTVGIIYRSPGRNIDIFSSKSTKLLENIKPEKKNCVIKGDFNTDLF